MADEDDQWLYGDSNPEPPGTEARLPGLDLPKESVKEVPPPGEEEENNPPEVKDDEDEEVAPPGVDEEDEETAEGDQNGEAAEGDEDEDSDDDNVNVVIGDISKAAPTYTNLNVHKRGGLVPASKGVGSKFSIEEFESVGVINGVSAVDFNVEGLEDKPWRKPGADITDYFNYGFNEETWKAYCDRQRRIRMNDGSFGGSAHTSGNILHVHGGGHIPVQQQMPPKRFEATGQISVVGGNIGSRRHDEPVHLPPMGIPPPGFPPIVPQFQQPPPFFPPGPGPDFVETFDQWRPETSWAPTNLITPVETTSTPPPPDGFNLERETREEVEDREREEREREEREERERRDRHRRSRSRSHVRERSRARSRSRSPSHKKHKKKSKKTEKSDKKRRSDDSE